MSGSSARESDTFADQLAAGLAGYGPRPFIEFERTWYTGNDIAVLISAIEDTLRRGGVLPGEPVALVVRNRIAHAAAVLGFIATQRPVSMIYSYQSETAIAADIRDVRPAALLADPVDLGVRVLDAVREVGGVAVELNPQGAGTAERAANLTRTIGTLPVRIRYLDADQRYHRAAQTDIDPHGGACAHRFEHDPRTIPLIR